MAAFSPFTRLLAAVAVGLTLVSLVLNTAASVWHAAPGTALHGMTMLFDVVRDSNVPTWFSSVILLIAAILVLQVERIQGFSARRPELLGMVVGFTFMSVDETARIHERLNEPIRQSLDLGGILYYSWVVAAVPLVVLLAIVYRRWLFGLSSRVRTMVIVGGVVFVFGAIALEAIGAGLRFGVENTRAAGLIGHAEELCEMLGVILFIEAMAIRLRELDWDGVIRISPRSPAVIPTDRDAQSAPVGPQD